MPRIGLCPIRGNDRECIVANSFACRRHSTPSWPPAILSRGCRVGSTPGAIASRASYLRGLLPATLFQLMSHQASLPPVDTRVLIVYFGGCLLVFVIGRIIGALFFKLDGTAQSVFGLGGIYSNILLTGLAIAKIALGASAVPVVALLLVFNALILWTLVSVSVEWSRHGSFSASGFRKTALSLLRNPFILAIVGGAAFGRLGFALPPRADAGLAAVGSIAAPAAMITLGMGLAAFPLSQEWASGLTVCALG